MANEQEIIFKCISCHNQFHSTDDLEKHERIHENEETFSCENGEKTFASNEEMMHEKTQNNEKLYSCMTCEETFASLNDLRSHKRRAHDKTPPNEKPYSCPKCDEKFAQSKDLRNHERTHTEVLTTDLFNCNSCDKKFPRLQNLKDHEKIHSKLRGKSTDCDFCSKNVENEKPFTCSECDKNKSSNSQIKVMSWNICRGTGTHMTEIEAMIRNESADLIFLLETDQSKENLESIKIRDYKTVVGSPGKSDGKVRLMAFINNSLPHKFREDLSSPDASIMWLEIERSNKKNLLVAGVYREWGYEDRSHPKNRSIIQQKERLEIITKSISTASSEKKEIIMAGDFNLDMKRWNDEAYGEVKKVADLWRNAVSKNGLLYEDLGITYCHMNGQTKSALDHIYFSSKIANNCRKLSNSFSDHFPVMVDLEVTKNRPSEEDQFILKRCHKNFNKELFLQDLLNQKWDSQVFADPSVPVHEKAALYDTIFENCYDKHAPKKKFKIKKNYKHGLSRETLKLIRERDLARLESVRASETDKHILAIKYRKLRNRVIAKIRKESKEAVIEEMRKNNAPSDFWKTVKTVTLPPEDQKIEIHEKGEIIRDEKQVADVMCPFFKEKIEIIDSKIPKIDISPTSKLEEAFRGKNLKFSLRTVSENQVVKAIKSLKNKSSSGVDFISPKMVKLAVDIIKVPLTSIINSSIAQGEFPECWKWAKIIPIFKKKGSKFEKENYRPVSLLKSSSKVLEIIVNQQVLNYAEQTGILPKSQFGFRSKRSTFNAIATMHDCIVLYCISCYS